MVPAAPAMPLLLRRTFVKLPLLRSLAPPLTARSSHDRRRSVFVVLDVVAWGSIVINLIGVAAYVLALGDL